MKLHTRHSWIYARPAPYGGVVEVCAIEGCPGRRLRAEVDRACCGHCARARHDLCGLGDCCRVLVRR